MIEQLSVENDFLRKLLKINDEFSSLHIPIESELKEQEISSFLDDPSQPHSSQDVISMIQEASLQIKKRSNGVSERKEESDS